MTTSYAPGDYFSYSPPEKYDSNGNIIGYDFGNFSLNVSNQILSLQINMEAAAGSDVSYFYSANYNATASRGTGASCSGTIQGVRERITFSCNAFNLGQDYSSSGYVNGKGGSGAYLQIGGTHIVTCGGGGGGRVTFNSSTHQVSQVIDGHNATDTSFSRNLDGNGTTTYAGQSSIFYGGLTGDLSLGDAYGSPYFTVSIYEVQNLTPQIDSFTIAPSPINAGETLNISWEGSQDVPQGDMLYTLDISYDGGNNWTSLLSNSTLTSFTKYMEASYEKTTLKFRVKVKNNNFSSDYLIKSVYVREKGIGYFRGIII